MKYKLVTDGEKWAIKRRYSWFTDWEWVWIDGHGIIRIASAPEEYVWMHKIKVDYWIKRLTA